jgi:hypothetical protein
LLLRGSPPAERSTIRKIRSEKCSKVNFCRRWDKLSHCQISN